MVKKGVVQSASFQMRINRFREKASLSQKQPLIRSCGSCRCLRTETNAHRVEEHCILNSLRGLELGDLPNEWVDDRPDVEVPVRHVSPPLLDARTPLRDVKQLLHHVRVLVRDVKLPVHHVRVLVRDVKLPVHDVRVLVRDVKLPVHDVRAPVHDVRVLVHDVKRPVHDVKRPAHNGTDPCARDMERHVRRHRMDSDSTSRT